MNQTVSLYKFVIALLVPEARSTRLTTWYYVQHYRYTKSVLLSRTVHSFLSFAVHHHHHHFTTVVPVKIFIKMYVVGVTLGKS